MVQAIDNPIAANFLTDAVVERHNFSQLNKTRIRFRIQLKKSTKSAAPKWADVVKAEVCEIESDLVKVTNSEVGLRGIKVFKKLDEAAAQLRQEIASVQEWMSADTGDWVCPIDLAPLVWNQLINIRDNIAPGLRDQLKVDYEAGLEDYQERIDQFLSLQTWPAIESKNLGNEGGSQLQQKIDSIRTKLLDEQRNLQQLATGDVGLSKATVMSFKFR
ncbi:hypothetical protein [Nostoc sp.]|uniref:hypothetical protein n=1 Tax=Nostoc sp. TaxID=1180 RepID=UPI002FF61424